MSVQMFDVHLETHQRISQRNGKVREKVIATPFKLGMPWGQGRGGAIGRGRRAWQGGRGEAGGEEGHAYSGPSVSTDIILTHFCVLMIRIRSPGSPSV